MKTKSDRRATSIDVIPVWMAIVPIVMPWWIAVISVVVTISPVIVWVIVPVMLAAPIRILLFVQ